ncbi:hypothetical protein [Endozoicomonas numazuensis]|uniref:hypothetical protein n=1 Tax=Endozoicomonas numazuensis TaxID=1137799 RepID=UPI0006911C9C|nr:hypothetical protein [Endozoicomonas numazuensis]
MDFKDYFDYPLCKDYADRLQAIVPDFDRNRFNTVIGDQLLNLEMKGRVNLIAEGVWEGLSLPYPETVKVICQAIAGCSQYAPMRSFPVWVASQVVERYGLEDFDASMAAIYQITQQFTGEFAIRPFLERYPERTFDLLTVWASDHSTDVRRLVSEGSRPRLPWAMRVSHLLDDPSPIFDLLVQLKDDPEEYVRRSVANNMNDIAKDSADRVVHELTLWKEQDDSKELQWIIQHGLRTLLKNGHKGALSLMGYDSELEMDINHFKASPASISEGESVELQCQLSTFNDQPEQLMIDFLLLSPGKNGRKNRKVFKWSKRTLNQAGKVVLNKQLSLKSNSVRKFYPGEYEVHLIVNGQEKAVSVFDVEN